MQERIVGAVLGGARLVLVVVALAVAIVPIGRSAISGFCPPASALEDAGPPSLVLAAPAVGLATSSIASATDVEPDATGTGTAPAPTSTDAPALDGGTPTEGATDGTPDDGATGAGETGAPCPGGVDRCLPPLVSAVVSFGGGPCGGEALAMMRGSMLPAFGIATVLLAAAWALRPRHGHPVLSRW